MLMEWLELLMWVLVGFVTWLGAAVIIAQTEQRGPPEAARARDGSHPSRLAAGSGPRLYADVERDHRDYGDEDPPAYYRCRKCDGRLFRARDGLRCHNCGLLAGIIARPKRDHVKRRRDGVQVSDEANAELLKDVFGAEGPTC